MEVTCTTARDATPQQCLRVLQQRHEPLAASRYEARCPGVLPSLQRGAHRDAGDDSPGAHLPAPSLVRQRGV